MEAWLVGGVDMGGLMLFLLATPVQFVSGWSFYRDAWLGAKHGRLGMAALVALGTSAAYASSCVELLLGLAEGRH
eukprot:4044623-Amphidinium_carterae.1